jgi:hypothetical protein
MRRLIPQELPKSAVEMPSAGPNGIFDGESGDSEPEDVSGMSEGHNSVDIDSANESKEVEAIRGPKSAHKSLAVHVHNFAYMIDFNADFTHERVFKYLKKATAMVLMSERKIDDKKKRILSHGC